MLHRKGPELIGKAHPKPAACPLPADLAAVALIDAPTCASVGGLSLSWWHAEVAAGRAPKPVIRQPRCTRWRLADVRDYWTQRAEQGIDDSAPVMNKAKRASAAAKAKRDSAAPARARA